MKPFNLERALAGDPVVTGDGRKVLELHLFKTLHRFPIVAFVEGDFGLSTYTQDGKSGSSSNSPYDLFMASVKKSVVRWVNVYQELVSGFPFGVFYETKELAIGNASKGRIDTVPVTIEWEE